MKLSFNRLRRVPWTFRQPLTRIPDYNSSISDLFLWRRGEDWSTVFELINMPGIITGDIEAESPVELQAFDSAGKSIVIKKFNLQGAFRHQIEFDELFKDIDGQYGTFAIFHEAIPAQLQESGSFLAERGYTGYRFQQAPIFNYAHGNLDAVARELNGNTSRLESDSMLPRSYVLQYEFNPDGQNELALVNASSKGKKITFYVESMASGRVLAEFAELIPAGGCVLKNLHQVAEESFRIRIRSRLVMARPLIFVGNEHYRDAFHG